MGRHPPARCHRHDDRGITTTAVLLGLSVGLLALVAFTNFLTWQYGRGAVRTAIEQAAQAGSRASASTPTCETRAKETLAAILGGALGDNVAVTCEDDGDHIRATATATFDGWLPVIPDYTFTDTAITAKEQAP